MCLPRAPWVGGRESRHISREARGYRLGSEKANLCYNIERPFLFSESFALQWANLVGSEFPVLGGVQAEHGLSLVVASGGYSSLWCAGFSLGWLLLLRSTGSRHAGFSSCGTWTQ